MNSRLMSICLLGLVVGSVGCKSSQPTTTAVAKPTLGINPYGTSGEKPDMSKVPDLSLIHI